MALAAARQKKCKNCGVKFTPWNSMQVACSPLCALDWTRKQSEKAARRRNREAKQKLKTRRDWEKEAQREFNKFIRERDKDEPCICCGKDAPGEDWKPGGRWDAGHFLSVGSHPELRFEELNCHKQLKSCNAGAGRFTRKNRTVSQQYRERLIAKIGEKNVEWLEGPHDAKHYTIDDLKAIRDEYRMKTRELRKQREAI